MSRFFSNLKKYGEYILYSSLAHIRAEQMGSYLNWVWLILEPFLFMMVYSFVALVVFGRNEPYFIPFVIIGYGMWQFFARNMRLAVVLIRRNKSVLSRIYLPKYILLFSSIAGSLIEMLVTLALALLMTLLYDITYTWKLIYVPLVVLEETLIVFGFSCVLMHCGVYVSDLKNMIGIVLRLIFYMSGVFYNLGKRVPMPYAGILLYCNPVAMVINEMRNVMLYGKAPNFLYLGVWFVLGILISAFGIHLIHKHEQNYVKAV